MSRSKSCAACGVLEAELARWKQDYKDLALAVARREGYPTPTAPTPVPPAPQPLPASVWAAIEDTTLASSEARTAAIDAARALLESGMAVDDVETHLRAGDPVTI